MGYFHELTSVEPSETEALLAQETSHRLASLLGKQSAIKMQIVEGNDANEVLNIPNSRKRLSHALRLNRLQQIIYSVYLECTNGMRIVGCRKNDSRDV